MYKIQIDVFCWKWDQKTIYNNSQNHHVTLELISTDLKHYYKTLSGNVYNWNGMSVRCT